MKNILRNEINLFRNYTRDWKKDVVIIFLTVAVVQTISYYFTSRLFFRANFFYTCFIDETKALNYEFWYWVTGDIIVFLLFPLAVIYFLHRMKPVDFGFRRGDYKSGLLYTLAASFLMFVLLWFVSAEKGFAEQYPVLVNARKDVLTFVLCNAGLLLYLVAWEFLWRGYMLFGLEKYYGSVAVLIQMLPFVILHNGKPFLETAGAIPGGIILGLLALRTRSFFFGVLIHFSVLFYINFYSVLRFNTGNYGTGISDFVNLILSIFN